MGNFALSRRRPCPIFHFFLDLKKKKKKKKSGLSHRQVTYVCVYRYIHDLARGGGDFFPELLLWGSDLSKSGQKSMNFALSRRRPCPIFHFFLDLKKKKKKKSETESPSGDICVRI